MPNVAPQVFSFGQPTMFPLQKESPSIEHLHTSNFKESRISLRKKFDDMHSKF